MYTSRRVLDNRLFGPCFSASVCPWWSVDQRKRNMHLYAGMVGLRLQSYVATIYSNRLT